MKSEFENEMLALELVNDRIKLKQNLHSVRFFTKSKHKIFTESYRLGGRTNRKSNKRLRNHEINCQRKRTINYSFE